MKYFCTPSRIWCCVYVCVCFTHSVFLPRCLWGDALPLFQACLCVSVRRFCRLLAATPGSYCRVRLFKVKNFIISRSVWTIYHRIKMMRLRTRTSCRVSCEMVWSRLLSSSLSCCTSCRRAWTYTQTHTHTHRMEGLGCGKALRSRLNLMAALTCVLQLLDESVSSGLRVSVVRVSSSMSSSWTSTHHTNTQH